MFELFRKERTGRSISKENRREVQFNGEDPSLPRFAKLCRLMMETGRVAFLTFLNNQHAPSEIASWLAQSEIHKVLRRLKIREIITEEEWQQLYNNSHRHDISLSNYDLTLLLLLVKYASNLNKPFPNGWTGAPRESDSSSGAVVVRFSRLRRKMARLPSIDQETYSSALKELRQYVTHFAGDIARESMHKIRVEGPPDDPHLWLTKFRNWHRREETGLEREENLISVRERRSADIPVLQSRIMMRRERHEAIQAVTPVLRPGTTPGSMTSLNVPQGLESKKLSTSPRVGSNPSIKTRWADILTGMVYEEKCIMDKFYERLTTEIKPDAVIDQLLQRKVITMEDSNDVFSVLKSHDQMKILLRIIVQRPGDSFQEFMASLKSRYALLHSSMQDEYVKVMEQIKASKPAEGVPYCQKLLIERYQELFDSWKPILWYPELEVKLSDFYCPLQIYDLKGKTVELEDLLKKDKSDEPAPRLVVIEGDSGTGKSTLAKYLALQWSENTDFFQGTKQIKLVFYIDLKIPAANLKFMMIEQLFGSTFQLTERELWEVIEDHQSSVLFIFDGYEDNITKDTLDIINGVVAYDVTTLVLSNTKFTPELRARFNRKYIITGFVQKKAEEFVQKYVKYTRRPRELFEPLLEKLNTSKKEITFLKETATHDGTRTASPSSTSLPPPTVPQESDTKTSEYTANEDPVEMNPNENAIAIRQRAGSIIAGTLMGFTKPTPENMLELKNKHNALKKTEKPDLTTAAMQERLFILRYYAHIPLFCSFFCAMTDLRLSIDLSSWTAMIEQFLSALKMRLIERGHESRFNVNKTYSQLADIAIDTIKNGMCTVFVRDHDNDCLARLGILQETVNFSDQQGDCCERYYFPNRILQEFLAARSLDIGGFDESSRFFQGCNMTRQLHNVAVFYCGMRKNDFETMALRALFNKITEINRRVQPNVLVEDEVAEVANQTTAADSPAQVSAGNIMDFQFGLDCISLMSGKKEQTQIVVQTLPEHIKIDHKGIVPVITLLGMSYIIEADIPKVRHIDFRLDSLAKQIPNVYTRLAEAIKGSQYIQTVRIVWQEHDLMSEIFARICSENASTNSLEFVDESHTTPEKMSSKLWANIRKGCEAMKEVKAFGFKTCRHVSLVNAVLRNIALTLHELDLSGCDINIIASQELAKKIEQSSRLQKVVMSGVRIESMAFNTFVKAFCRNRSVLELNLSKVKLDNVCFFSLSEALKANNKLERLILTQVPINLRSCEELAQVMKINSTLREMCLSPNKVAHAGKHILAKNARHVRLNSLYESRKSVEYIILDPMEGSD